MRSSSTRAAVDRPFLVTARLAWATGLLMVHAMPAQAAGPVTATGAMATLTVVYEVKGSGDEVPSSKERHTKWSIDDRYEVKASMPAMAPSPLPSLHKSGGSPDAQASAVAGADQAAAMAMAMAAQAKCGNDGACLQREIARAMTGASGNYQIFQFGTQTGSFRVAEQKYHAAFDAACSLRNEASCAVETSLKGSGPLSLAGKTPFETDARAEVDLDRGGLMLVLPWAGKVKLEQVVKSAAPEVKSGTSIVERKVGLGKLSTTPIQVNCGDCRSASGALTQEITDDLAGRKAVLGVTCGFSRP